MALLRGSEGEVRGGGLIGELCGGLFHARLGKARRLHQLGEFVLILRRVEAAIERQLLDLILETLLQSSRFRHRHVAVGLGATEQAMLREESCGVLEHQHQAAELHRLTGLASFVELRMRLEEAEQLLVVGHFLALDHAAMSHLAHLLRACDERLQRRELQQFAADVLADVLVRRTSGRVFLQCGEQLVRSAKHSAAFLQQFDVLGLQPLGVVRALLGRDAGDVSRHTLHGLEQLSVLSPTAQSA